MSKMAWLNSKIIKQGEILRIERAEESKKQRKRDVLNLFVEKCDLIIQKADVALMMVHEIYK